MLAPPGFNGQNSALVRAAEWLSTLVTGSLATSVAIIVIALVGFGMLVGRVDVRRGGSAIVGCFILFGAPAIAQAFMNLAQNETTSAAPAYNTGSVTIPPVPDTPEAQDPYSGASLIR